MDKTFWVNVYRDENGKIRHGMRCHSRRQADNIAATSSASLRRLYTVRVRMKRDGR